MKTDYFDIGDGAWGIVLCYDYDSRDERRLLSVLRSFGVQGERADEAMAILSRDNTGMTLTSMEDKMSVLVIGQGSSDDEWFNTFVHELKHVVEHIGEYYDVDPKSEPSAYLQGEIGRQMFPIIMQRLCGCK